MCSCALTVTATILEMRSRSSNSTIPRSWESPSYVDGWRKRAPNEIAMMNKGGTQKLGDIKVTMVHADHSCGIQDGDQLIYGGEACGYVHRI